MCPFRVKFYFKLINLHFTSFIYIRNLVLLFYINAEYNNNVMKL